MVTFKTAKYLSLQLANKVHFDDYALQKQLLMGNVRLKFKIVSVIFLNTYKEYCFSICFNTIRSITQDYY